MPRLTRRAFVDLAVWMLGFGLLVGLAFPLVCLALGLPPSRVESAPFFASTVTAGLAVGLVNYILARAVVGGRLRQLARNMDETERALAAAMFSRDWSGCDPDVCSIAVDSDDEAGAAAAAFNRLVGSLARSHAVDTAQRGFSAILSMEAELDGLCQAALGGLMATTGADAGALLVMREGGLHLMASYGICDPADLIGSEAVRRVIGTSRIARLQVVEWAPVLDAELVGRAPLETLVAPVQFGRDPLGAVVLAATRAFDEDGVLLLDSMRADLGLAFSNALTRDRLERLAAVDPLTEVYNRRFGLARLREEFSRSARSGIPLGVLMVDLDRFKSINDTYGHLMGDRVLREVAASIRAVIREGDVLIRYGGEEFLVLLPGAPAANVAAVGERMRRSVSGGAVADGTITVTVSIGGSVSDAATPSAESLVDAADHALYEAKQTGRDRLVLAA
jgi:diguanylate cyclase (GGDEF)-like protein